MTYSIEEPIPSTTKTAPLYAVKQGFALSVSNSHVHGSPNTVPASENITFVMENSEFAPVYANSPESVNISEQSAPVPTDGITQNVSVALPEPVRLPEPPKENVPEPVTGSTPPEDTPPVYAPRTRILRIAEPDTLSKVQFAKPSKDTYTLPESSPAVNAPPSFETSQLFQFLISQESFHVAPASEDTRNHSHVLHAIKFKPSEETRISSGRNHTEPTEVQFIPVSFVLSHHDVLQRTTCQESSTAWKYDVDEFEKEPPKLFK